MFLVAALLPGASALLSAPPSFRRAIADAPWRGALEPARECVDARVLEVVQGRVPDELRGTLFRVGPGRLRVGEDVYGHWFDGDGWACAVAFSGADEPPRFRARYVETARLKAQRRSEGPGLAGRGAWSQRGDGSVLANAGRLPTTPSNTNIILHGGRVLVLCEGGSPAQLDAATLETLEAEVSDLGVDGFFAAHPKADARTGRLVGCGLQLGAAYPPPLNIFELDGGARGRPLVQRSLALPFMTFVHDLGVSARHVALVLPPWAVRDFATFVKASAFGMGALGHAFEWRPELGTRLIVLDRRTLRVRGVAALPGAPTAYHVINAFDGGGHVEEAEEAAEDEAAAGARRAEASAAATGGAERGGAELFTIQLAELRGGDRSKLEANFADMYSASFGEDIQCRPVEFVLELPAAGSPEYGRAEPGSATLLSRTELGGGTALPFELPDVAPAAQGRRARWAYTACLGHPDSTFLDAVQKVELCVGGGGGATTADGLGADGFGVARFPRGRCAGAPIFVPRDSAASGTPDATGFDPCEDDGFVLTYVYDPETHSSDLVVLDARDVGGTPLATVRVGQHVPPLFHGSWAPEVWM